MEKQENKFKYGQLETYKESLELTHLKRKTLIVDIILGFFALIIVYFVFGQKIPIEAVLPALLIFSILIIINILFYSQKHDMYNNLMIAMYVTIIGIYGIAIALVFKFETPSIFTVLFLAYAIISIYQDYKAMLLSSLLLFVSGGAIVLFNPDMFVLIQNSDPQTFYLLVFLLVFVLLLTLSSYILIKRKSFFYNQLASIKEAEIRNIDLMNQVEFINRGIKKDYSNYYDDLNSFSRELSKKIGVDDLFKRRIQLIKDMKKYKPLELLNKYPDFDLAEINDLAILEFEMNQKMSKLAIKASKSKGVSVSKKEIFNEAQFKSFNHFSDSLYTKIISFTVFYTLLKIDKPYLKALSEKQLRDIIYNSEYFYRVDRDVINVYLENSEVFEAIINDYLKGGW